jgi:hypothetical protein
MIPMKPKLLLGASAAIILGATGIAWDVARDAHGMQAECARLTRKATAVAAELKAAEARLAKAEHEAAAARSQVEQIKTADHSSKVATTRRVPPPLSAQELDKMRLESREKSKDTLQQLRDLANTRKYHAAVDRHLFDTLRLSPAQREKFLAIAEQRAAASMDISALVKQGLVAAEDSTVEKFKAAAKAEQDAAYRELLGADGFQQLQEHWRTEVARGLVLNLAAAAVNSGTPFAAPQLEQFVQIVANADSGYRGGGRVSADRIDWDLVHAQLRPLMTDAQWAVSQTGGSSNIGYQWSYGPLKWEIAKALKADAAAGPTKSRSGG